MNNESKDLQEVEKPFLSYLGEFFERHKLVRGGMIGLLTGTAVWAVLQFLRSLMPFDVFFQLYKLILAGLLLVFILCLFIKKHQSICKAVSTTITLTSWDLPG
jgi:hypothetical protein